MTTHAELAAAFYEALAAGDRGQLDLLVDPQLQGHATEGLPVGLGGSYPDATSMRRQFWGRIAKDFDARAEPTEYLGLDDGRLLVRGRYVGTARQSGGRLDAEFMHLLRFADDRIVGLDQLTDSARWSDALTGPPASPETARSTEIPTTEVRTTEVRTAEVRTTEVRAAEVRTTVRLEIAGGLGVVTIDRPEARNGIDQALADDLLGVAMHCTGRTDLRALLIAGRGRAFTVGGDVSVFAGQGVDELPHLLRSMIGPYHQALQLLTDLDVPVVAAVNGAVAGGGLGLIYCADLVIAADDTKFATGFAGLGLSGDGGNSWWLPRLVGPRRAAELYLEGRVLTAGEALEWGLITRVVPTDQLEAEATATARRLADGPTRAFAEMRNLLRRTWSNGLAAQHALELDAIARTAATSDAVAAIDSFVRRRKPTFEGR